jgi:predicted unusual protein kinase regulating ubiquinone biosynthesis (AarF/ABC1/UbiB family)
MSDDAKVPPQGKFQRFRKLAGLSATVGGDLLGRGMKKLVGVDAPPITRNTAQKLVATLGDLKGAAMKLGQMASMDADLLPPEVRAVLSRLQNEAPPMGWDVVERTLDEELGAPPERLFAELEHVPLAAASLGQVHRGRLKDGRQVAVKVQYPGMAEALASDLDNVGSLVRAVSVASKSLDGRAYFQELRAQMALELDYRREARLCQVFAAAAAPFGDLRVPEVVERLSAGKVLTLELLEGPTLKAFLAASPAASNEERYRVSAQLIRAIYGPFMLTGAMHADPHPGNFLVMPDGRLGVLDFGAVKELSEGFVRPHRRLFSDYLHGREYDLLEHLRDLGFAIDLAPEDTRALMTEFLTIHRRPLAEATYDYATDEIVKDTRKVFTEHAGQFLKLRPPAEAVLFVRSAGGLAQNLRLLGARGNFRQVYEELVETVERNLLEAATG